MTRFFYFKEDKRHTLIRLFFLYAIHFMMCRFSTPMHCPYDNDNLLLLD